MPLNRRNGSRILAHSLLIAIFCGFIAAPLVFQIFRLDPGPDLHENRNLASFPKLELMPQSWNDFPEGFEAYYNDNFPGRRLLIRGYDVAMFSGLHVSTSSQVVLGKDGWLFAGDQNSLANYRGVPPFTQEQLESWAQVINERANWLQSRGIRYLVTIIPEKQSIYPEYMPDDIPRDTGAKTKLDQLIDYLRTHTNVEILDIRQDLIAEKDQRQLYLKNDTHWTCDGAYIDYRRILESLAANFPALKPDPRSSFKEIPLETPDGDLVNLLGLTGLYSEPWVKLEPSAGIKAKRVDSSLYDPEYVTIDRYKSRTTVVDDPKLPTAVMYRDSFATILMPFLSEHFRRITYIWNSVYNRSWGCDFDPAIIENEKPDIFIEEFVERHINDVPTNWTARRLEFGITAPKPDRDSLVWRTGQKAELYGWVVGDSNLIIHVTLNGRPLSVVLEDRPDVVKNFPKYSKHAGFRVAVPVEHLRRPADLQITVNGRILASFAASSER